MSENINNPKNDPLWKEAVASAKLSDSREWKIIGEYAEAKEEIARLTAENERLRKAGDDVVRNIEVCSQNLFCAIHRWDAAKEGRDAK